MRSIQVSVCISTYNCSDVLAGAINSVLSQRGLNVELLIADGGSTDGTVSICSSYIKELAWFHSEPDRGIYDAWNKMVPHARGEWICFIGADDVFKTQDSLSRLWAGAAGRPLGSRLVYGRVRYESPDPGKSFEQGEPWAEAKRKLVKAMSIPHVGMLQHRSIFDEGFRFDSDFKIAGDFEMVRSEGLIRAAHFVDEVIIVAGIGGVSTRPETELTHVHELRRILIRQDGRVSFDWYKRYAKTVLRSMIYRVAGHRGLEAYGRLKSSARACIRTILSMAGKPG